MLGVWAYILLGKAYMGFELDQTTVLADVLK